MDQQSPSRTAIRTAVQRAAHLLLDNDPKILADPFARAFAGYGSDTEMLTALDPTQLLDSPRLRTLFVLRNRYAEDELVQAIARGIESYVILGAGFEFVRLPSARPYGLARRLRGRSSSEPSLETRAGRGTRDPRARAPASRRNRLRANNIR